MATHAAEYGGVPPIPPYACPSAGNAVKRNLYDAKPYKVGQQLHRCPTFQPRAQSKETRQTYLAKANRQFPFLPVRSIRLGFSPNIADGSPLRKKTRGFRVFPS